MFDKRAYSIEFDDQSQQWALCCNLICYHEGTLQHVFDSDMSPSDSLEQDGSRLAISMKL